MSGGTRKYPDDSFGWKYPSVPGPRDEIECKKKVNVNGPGIPGGPRPGIYCRGYSDIIGPDPRPF